MREKGKLYPREHSIPFKPLLVKEILVDGPWRFDFVVPQCSLIITTLAKYVTISVLCLFPSERFSHETVHKRFSMDGQALIKQDQYNICKVKTD